MLIQENHEKCCLIDKHTCFPNGYCKKGIQKRCGKYSQTSCDKTLANCNNLSPDQCIIYPNNMYCSVSEDGFGCKHRSGVFGEDINCGQLTPDLAYNQIGCVKNVPSNEF